jgi:hypothetical protein
MKMKENELLILDRSKAIWRIVTSMRDKLRKSKNWFYTPRFFPHLHNGSAFQLSLNEGKCAKQKRVTLHCNQNM